MEEKSGSSLSSLKDERKQLHKRKLKTKQNKAKLHKRKTKQNRGEVELGFKVFHRRKAEKRLNKN